MAETLDLEGAAQLDALLTKLLASPAAEPPSGR
jgi:hypothetical protein